MVTRWEPGTVKRLPSAGGRLLCFPEVLPALPFLPATWLRLELLLAERIVNLRALCEVVLDDLGATIEVMRSVGAESGEENGAAFEQHVRMEEWVAHLDLAEWFNSRAQCSQAEPAALGNAWRHARLVANYARTLAADTSWCCPAEGYIAALLYRLGDLPELLGWSPLPCPPCERAMYLARAFHLPLFTRGFLRDQDQLSTPWAALLTKARLLATHARQVA